MMREEEESWIDGCMQDALQGRRRKANLRRLRYSTTTTTSTTDFSSATSQYGHDDDYEMDFSSNDYLGLAHSPEQHALVELMYARECSSLHSSSASSAVAFLGSTGSRLLSGDAPHFHLLEDYLAQVHGRAAALLCNSGYDANLSVVSSLPADVIVYDEYVHNSLHMGMRLWKTQSTTTSQFPIKEMVPFHHNSVHDLERVLQQFSIATTSSTRKNLHLRRVVVLVESVYSMDGDISPLKQMLDVAYRYNAVVVVDEAHGLGVFGRKALPPLPPSNQGYRHNNTSDDSRMLPPRGTGVLAQYELEHHPALLCSIHTFGKAPGCHGAVVCCRNVHAKDYLVNFAYPFIYSTALPMHAVVAIRASYETFTGRRGDKLRARLFELVQLFQGQMQNILSIGGAMNGGGVKDSDNKQVFLLPSTSPIQALMISGNARCVDFCQRLYQTSSKRILLYPIKSPTVPVGQERVRIILHAHNTRQEVQELFRLIQYTLHEMGHLPNSIGRSKL